MTARFVARILAQTPQLSSITDNYFAVNDDVETRAKTTTRRRRRPRTGASTDDMSQLRRRWYRLFSLPPLRPPSTTLYPAVPPLFLLSHLSSNFCPYQLILKAPFYAQLHKFNLLCGLFSFQPSFSLNFCSHLVNSDVNLFLNQSYYFILSSLFQEFFLPPHLLTSIIFFPILFFHHKHM